MLVDLMRQGRSDLRYRIEQELDALDYCFSTYSHGSFIQHIETCIGRKIEIIPCRSLTKGIFGVWISDSDSPTEYIFFKRDLSRGHAEHTVLHELSHIILGHQTRKLPLGHMAELLEHGQLEQVLCRSTRKIDDEEREAELMAFIIKERAKECVSTSSRESDDLVSNLGLG